MAGEQMRLLWGLVYLVGLIGTSMMIGQGNLANSVAQWAWFIILIVSGMSIGKSFGMKWPENVKVSWKVVTTMFIVLAGTMLLGVWSGNAAVLFALFLLLNGGAKIASGLEMKNSIWTTIGFTDLALGIVYPTWFGTSPYLAAALILGVPVLLSSMKMKK